MKPITELRKQLAKKGYRLVKNGKNGYIIIDKYTNGAKHVLSLNTVALFLKANYINYCFDVGEGKIPPLKR